MKRSRNVFTREVKQPDIDQQKQQPILNVAVVSFSSLGDSLLYILMAHNLSINGFNTTFFGNVGYQLRHWLEGFEIRPYPDLSEMHEILGEFHIVFICPSNEMRQKMIADSSYLDLLRKRYILICQNVPSTWVWDHTCHFQEKLTPELYEKAKPFVNASGSIRLNPHGGKSVVEMLLDYMHNTLGLKNITKTIQLSQPYGLRYRSNINRIIVSPDSAGSESKNWGVGQFLLLCNRLKSLGYDPKIVVSPENHFKWQTLSRGRYDVPIFKNIGDLAAYIFESSSVIANDSGNGHLASFLNIPIVTIYQKNNHEFRWRPDWLPAKVVCPKISINLFGWRIWKPFVTVNMVLFALSEIQ